MSKLTNSNTTKQELQSLLAQLSESIKHYHDPSGQAGLKARTSIVRLAKGIIDEVKQPEETPMDYATSMLEIGAIGLFMEWKAFDLIPDEGSVSYKDLAEKLGAEEVLVTRLAWILVATGLLKQPSTDYVAHSRFSPMYKKSNPQGAYFQVFFDCALKPIVQWPAYFEKYGRKEPQTDPHSPFSFAEGRPEAGFWEIISQDEQRLADFNISMATADQLLPVTGMFPFSWIVENASKVAEDAPLVVDVGGGKGHALARMLKEAPEIPASRMVLEDRPDTIDEVKRIDLPELRDVKKLPHDFFTEQPVKGALVYWIRRVMHDWSDANCITILSHLAQACTEHSRVLICEQLMPDPPTELSAHTDLCMLNLGGKERTKKNWYDVTEKAGLKVVKFWESGATTVAVVECVKA